MFKAGVKELNGSAYTLHKLHFHSKAKINVGCSFLTFPLHKNLMAQSSTQPVDNQIENGEIQRNHWYFSSWFIPSPRGPRATYSEWLSRMGGKAQGISRYPAMYR